MSSNALPPGKLKDVYSTVLTRLCCQHFLFSSPPALVKSNRVHEHFCNHTEFSGPRGGSGYASLIQSYQLALCEIGIWRERCIHDRLTQTTWEAFGGCEPCLAGMLLCCHLNFSAPPPSPQLHSWQEMLCTQLDHAVVRQLDTIVTNDITKLGSLKENFESSRHGES